MATKQSSIGIWAVVNSNKCVNLIVADQNFADNFKSKNQAVVNADDLLPDYQVKIGDIYDPKTKSFSHPAP